MFLGCTCGVAFLAPFDSPTLRPSPAVTNLGGLRCGPPHWLSLRLCVDLSRAAELCLLSLLLLGAGLAVVEPLPVV